ncbi:amidase domain-containing protein [Oscillibacter sp.]|uniref:amidase domain-containing protein n=1 Tax=Oscillibacter sp. TaxID=1945593 RepID=UPI0028A16121|nr:amidase domain-containing protein [Oscillibacter sp.]
MKKKMMSLALALVMCLSLCVPAFAVENDNAPHVTQNNVTNLACNTATQLLEDYYDVTNVSGEITNVEATSGEVNYVVDVSYTTQIKAKTPDDAPYIQGILAAMEDLTDESELQRANDYLTIWRGELEREHIGKELSHNAEFIVSVPLLLKSSNSDINSNEFLNTLSVENAEVKVHTYDELHSSASRAVYVDEPLSSFVPTAQEAMENARNDVSNIISGNSSNQVRGVRASSTSRAQELDRVDAAYYAKQESNFPIGHRPDGSKYAHYDSDCANFVSQCYSAGGVAQDSVWYDDSSCWNLTGGPRKSPGHYGITDYMLENDIVFHAGTGTWNRAFAGSIMYYPTSLTEQAHVGIITSNDGQTAYYSAHTSNHRNEKMSDYYKTVMDFYIPVWDSHTGTWTPQ